MLKTECARPIIKTSPNRMHSGFVLTLNILQLNKSIQSAADFDFVDEGASVVSQPGSSRTKAARVPNGGSLAHTRCGVDGRIAGGRQSLFPRVILPFYFW
ncbi:MAG TPA: hypothetical protein PK043_05360 [Alicycliphilus sp.]|nr:hypothetical protein [Alicycliphilus sp.]HRP19677.1 hypothetical protein [Alicycliphilus sp.]